MEGAGESLSSFLQRQYKRFWGYRQFCQVTGQSQLFFSWGIFWNRKKLCPTAFRKGRATTLDTFHAAVTEHQAEATSGTGFLGGSQFEGDIPSWGESGGEGLRQLVTVLLQSGSRGMSVTTQLAFSIYPLNSTWDPCCPILGGFSSSSKSFGNVFTDTLSNVSPQ